MRSTSIAGEYSRAGANDVPWCSVRFSRIAVLLSVVLFSSAVLRAQDEKAAKPAEPVGALAGAPVVWQLGVADGKSAEFLPFRTGHFCHNWEVIRQPGWDQERNAFNYTIVKPGIDPKPLYPAGISGPTAGTSTWCRQQTISWTDDGQGWRVLEIPLLDSHTFDFRRNNLSHHAVDPDTMPHARYSLRAVLPDGQVTHTYVPYDVPSYEKENGPIVMRVSFRSQAGANRLELCETSGRSMFRNYHFDYLRLSRAALPLVNPPTVEIEPAEGFLHHTVYNVGTPAWTNVRFYNLPSGEAMTARLRFVDFFDRTVADETLPVVADPDGRGSARFACPAGLSGHLRVSAELLQNGQPVGIQMGLKAVRRFFCAVRPIASLTDEEIDMSFIGLCGLSRSGTFDVYRFRQDNDREDDVYRAFRRTLQIHHERYHSLSWAHLEPRENDFRWEYWDAVFTREKEERIRLQLGVTGTPEWLLYKHHPERKKLKSIHDKLYSCPPDMEKWGDVCAKIAERYRDRIADFEVWNEPSEHSMFWYEATAQDYFNLVKNAALAVRRVAPEINIVAETVWARQPEFYQKLYKLGVAQYVDFPADHYLNEDRIRLVNQFLDDVGRGKGLINNETHSASCGSRKGEITEDERRTAARSLSRNIIYANAHRIKRIYEFQLLSPGWRKWGFLGPTDEPRYSFCAFKTLVNRTTGAEFRRSLALGDKVEGYVYRYLSAQRIAENGGDNALFLFNRGSHPRPIRLYVNKPHVTVVDLMDNARQVETPDGLFVWKLTDDPVIVIGADEDALGKQDALVIQPVAPSAKPGGTVHIDLSLAVGQDGPADVEINASALSSTPQTAVVLTGKHPVPVFLPLREDLREGIYSLEIIARLPGADGPIPVYRQIPVTVASVGLGDNHFAADTFAPDTGEWTTWGDGWKRILPAAPGALTAARLDIDKEDGAGGFTAVSQTVIPGARYHIMFRARGKGTLRLQLTKSLENGQTKTDHNLISGTLSSDWTLRNRDWTVPADVCGARFSIYLWHDVGWFEVTDFRFLRIPPDLPVNRLLFQATAQPAARIVVDGKLDEWPKEKFVPVDPAQGLRMEDYHGPEDSAVEFAVQWREPTLYFAAVVTDDVQHSGPDALNIWRGDSLQLDFEIDNRNTTASTAQISMGLIGDATAIYRHRTIPTEDIVPSYVTGSAPDGVTAAICRDGTRTVYEMAIETRAICPTFSIQSGQTIAFSFLVNDNDGKGRKGWLAWSGGIGGLGGSRHFGRLDFR